MELNEGNRRCTVVYAGKQPKSGVAMKRLYKLPR